MVVCLLLFSGLVKYLMALISPILHVLLINLHLQKDQQ